MNELIVGLIKGRHEMPVENYIFENEIKDVFDFVSIENQIENFIKENKANKLIVYVTGLTCVTSALIKVCNKYNIKLILMHYNRESNNYIPQLIF